MVHRRRLRHRFTQQGVAARVDPICHGGPEHSLGRTRVVGGHLPYVAKSLYFSQHLAGYLDRGELEIKRRILPMRDLFGAAESRRQVTARAALAGRDPGGALRRPTTVRWIECTR